MVFKHKQPPLGPRRRASPREVARALDVDIDTVMAALASLGEYVPSPSSKVEEPVARRLYEALGGQYEQEESKPPSQWEQNGRTDQRPAAKRLPTQSTGDGPTNWHSAAREDWWETQGDASPAMELESWKLFGFTEVERDAWIAHGLRPGQLGDAVSYREAGLVPTDLPKKLEGWTVKKRLQAGERPTDVVRLLRMPQQDDRAG